MRFGGAECHDSCREFLSSELRIDPFGQKANSRSLAFSVRKHRERPFRMAAAPCGGRVSSVTGPEASYARRSSHDIADSTTKLTADELIEQAKQTLRNADASVGDKEEACATLWNLAVDPEYRVMIRDANCILPLVACLSSGTATMKEKASGALWNLAVNVENREEIARAGGIQPLVAVLRSGTDVAQEKAAAALKNLATSNAHNQMEIGAQGGVVRLLEVCRNGSEKAQEKAAGALCNLAVHEGNRSKIIATGIPDLVALLTVGPSQRGLRSGHERHMPSPSSSAGCVCSTFFSALRPVYV